MIEPGIFERSEERASWACLGPYMMTDGKVTDYALKNLSRIILDKYRSISGLF